MCCFSRPVEQVANTRIFARDSRDGKQYLVYSMALKAKEDLAMILPLPTPKDSKEDALRYISLEKYPKFFEDMQTGFELPPPRGLRDAPDVKSEPKLKVVEVGSFEASFVPAVKDFARLDERFRLPTEVWDRLPAYQDWGFAVFKLKSGAKQIHPMAFEFPRANPKQLFFPTVHIHDGQVHEKASFDHALYCQSGSAKMTGWKESLRPAGMFLNAVESQGLIDSGKHCYFRGMKGHFKNEDIVV
jgi:hypothetical protein